MKFQHYRVRAVFPLEEHMKKEDVEKIRRIESVCLTVIDFGRLISRRLDELEDRVRKLQAKQENPAKGNAKHRRD